MAQQRKLVPNPLHGDAKLGISDRNALSAASPASRPGTAGRPIGSARRLNGPSLFRSCVPSRLMASSAPGATTSDGPTRGATVGELLLAGSPPAGTGCPLAACAPGNLRPRRETANATSSGKSSQAPSSNGPPTRRHGSAACAPATAVGLTLWSVGSVSATRRASASAANLAASRSSPARSLCGGGVCLTPCWKTRSAQSPHKYEAVASQQPTWRTPRSSCTSIAYRSRATASRWV